MDVDQQTQFRRPAADGRARVTEEVRSSGALDPVVRRLREAFAWLWGWGDAGEGDRGVFVRVLLTMLWLPVQITLSLIFATGGIFFLLIAGVILGPFVGLYFLIRHLVRKPADEESDGLT